MKSHLDKARNNGRRHGLGGVTDTEADDLGVGVLFQVLAAATSNLPHAIAHNLVPQKKAVGRYRPSQVNVTLPKN